MADLKNEQWFMKKYEEICKENPKGYAFISLKIKRFRIFNQIFGREAGDRLIEKVYQAISGWLKDREYAVWMYRGYYNMLVHMSDDYDDIFHRMIDLNRNIRDMKDEEGFGKVYSGIGIYLLTENPVDFYTAQYYADICRSECKERSYHNSHFEVYGMTYFDKNLLYFDLEQEIQPALENGDLRIYLQPKVDLKTGEVTQAEALLRWIDPVRGMIPVGEFLPGLEEKGLIDSIDNHMFGQVCKLINRWIGLYGKKIRISVNLSSNAFNYRYFFDGYKKYYDLDPCPKECIDFELLESIILNRVEMVRRVVKQLRDFGFSCSLDDFGSGYSCFNVLTNTEISTLKIDRSLFVDESDSRAKILIRHIIKTAHELGMKTVAEGVETKGFVEFLKELECEYVQGYVFYKPMPIEEFEERFLKNGEKAFV